jgi:hypothetical protein
MGCIKVPMFKFTTRMMLTWTRPTSAALCVAFKFGSPPKEYMILRFEILKGSFKMYPSIQATLKFAVDTGDKPATYPT